MDPTKIIPAPPTATDPVTWFAIAGFVVMILAIFYLAKTLRDSAASNAAASAAASEQSAKASREDRRELVTAFALEMQRQRDHDAQAVAETHKRIDGLTDEIRDMSKSIAACPRS